MLEERKGGMIFDVPGHIEMIRNDIKTQTRRVNRGIYQEGRSYAVQRKRGVKAETDMRIEMDDIWEEVSYETFTKIDYEPSNNARLMPVTLSQANDEGFWSSYSFEKAFERLNPKWDGKKRWAFKFHVVGI